MRTRPKWHEAYDAQMALWRWYRTPQSHDWLRGVYREGAVGVPQSYREVMNLMYDGETGRLVECDPIFVAAEMCELVDHARRDFQPEPLHDYDLPTPRAFVWYEKPIEIVDRYGHPISCRAFSWAQEYRSTTDDVSRIWERLYTEDAEERHGPRITPGEANLLVAEGLVEAIGVAITLYADREPYIEQAARQRGRRTGPRAEQARARLLAESAGTPVVPCHLAPWLYEQTFEGNDVDMNGEPTGAAEWWQLLQTTLRLMQQKIRPHGFGRPDRPTRRAAERLGFRPETEVVIVRLRTEEQERQDPSGNAANYSHRFIRSGHWRNQWYPSAKVHRQIWIAPTVVGDPSLPLLVRPRRVFQWTR